MSKIDLNFLEEQNHYAQQHRLKRGEIPPAPAPQQPDALILALLAIFAFFSTEQDSARIQTKVLVANGQAQSVLNQQENSMNFVQFTNNMQYSIKKYRHKHQAVSGPDGGVNVWYTTKTKKKTKTHFATHVQEQNQQVEKEREGVTNQLILLRQNAQIGESQLNSSVDLSQQTAQQEISALQMLVTISNQVCQM